MAARLTPAGWALAALLTVSALAAPAAAHAVPDTTQPPSGARVATAPANVSITFTQTPDPARSWVRVVDAAGERVDQGSTAFDGARATVGLPSSLDDGGYIVRWQALSAVDGHTTSGSFGFAVGNTTAPETAGIETPTPKASSVIGKGLAYLGLIAAGGATAFDRLVHASQGTRRWESYLATGSLVHLAGISVYTTSQVTGAGGAASYLAGTSFGRGLAVRLALASGLAGLALYRPTRDRRMRMRAVGLAVTVGGLFIGYGSYGHTAALVDATLVGALVDAAHLAAVAAWAGGLGALWLSLDRHGGEAPDGLADRFSRLATVCVALALGTGTVMLLAVVRLTVGELAAAWATAYGKLLYAKIALFFPMVGMGALNRLAHVREVHWLPFSTGGFPASVKREILVGVAILVLAGAVTTLSPAQPDAGTATPPEPLTLEANTSTYAYDLTIDPPPRLLATSEITINVTRTDNGSRVEEVVRLAVFAHPADNRSSGSEVELSHQGNGTYNTSGIFFTQPGNWSLLVTIETQEVYKEQIGLPLQVPDPMAASGRDN